MDGDQAAWSRSEVFGMTKGTEARNSSAWQGTEHHFMLLTYEVQSSERQRDAKEVDKRKIVKYLCSGLRTSGFFLYIVGIH